MLLQKRKQAAPFQWEGALYKQIKLHRRQHFSLCRSPPRSLIENRGRRDARCWFRRSAAATHGAGVWLSGKAAPHAPACFGCATKGRSAPGHTAAALSPRRLLKPGRSDGEIHGALATVRIQSQWERIHLLATSCGTICCAQGEKGAALLSRPEPRLHSLGKLFSTGGPK